MTVSPKLPGRWGPISWWIWPISPGLIAAGIHPNPFPAADFVTSTTHKTLRGPRGGLILAQPQYGKALDSQIFPGIQGGPLMHIIAAKAVAFKEALAPSFRRYQEQIVANARTLAREFLKQGYRLVAGGTDTHLILMDLTPTGLTGREAEEALDLAGITVNKNSIPFDQRPPTVTSGIRLGTPALTTRGMKERRWKSSPDSFTRPCPRPGMRPACRNWKAR